jgi:hypothetical protein
MRPGQPERAQDEEGRQEQPEQHRPYFALQERDRGDREQRGEGYGQVEQGLAVARAVVELRDVRDPGRGDAEQQQRGDPGRDHDRVDRYPACAGPVDVAQVQDQRELVEDQRGSDAEQHGRAHAPAERVRGAGDPGHPANDHEHHAEHHVMHVRAAAGDVPRPPAHLGPDHAHREPDKGKAGQERDEEAEQRQPPGMHDLRLEPPGHMTPTGRASPLALSP